MGIDKWGMIRYIRNACCYSSPHTHLLQESARRDIRHDDFNLTVSREYERTPFRETGAGDFVVDVAFLPISALPYLCELELVYGAKTTLPLCNEIPDTRIFRFFDLMTEPSLPKSGNVWRPTGLFRHWISWC